MSAVGLGGCGLDSSGACDEIRCVDAVGFLCVLGIVEVVQHSSISLASLSLSARCAFVAILLREIHVDFQCPAQKSIADLEVVSPCSRSVYFTCSQSAGHSAHVLLGMSCSLAPCRLQVQQQKLPQTVGVIDRRQRVEARKVLAEQ